MCDLILLYGIRTSSWYAEFALRRRVSMSAMGSVMVMLALGLSRRGFLSAPSLSPGWTGDGCGAGTYGVVVRFLVSVCAAYQELLVTPGSSPRCAISRRHTRHRPNLRYTECGRP